jgi:hypothetical protein
LGDALESVAEFGTNGIGHNGVEAFREAGPGEQPGS